MLAEETLNTGDTAKGVASSSTMNALPPLALVAAVAALIDLVLNRFAVLLLSEVMPHSELIEVLRIGDFPQNTAAFCSIVALTFALSGFALSAEHAGIFRRMGIAVFTLVLTIIGGVALVFPSAWTTVQLVLLAIGSSNVLTVLLSLTAARHPAPIGIRAGVVLLALGCLLAFVGLVVTLVGIADGSTIGYALRNTLTNLGSYAFLFSAPLIAITLARPLDTTRSRLNVVIAAVIFTSLLSVIGYEHVRLGNRFPDILLAAYGSEMFWPQFPWIYFAALVLPIAAGALGILSGDPIKTQAGAGLWLIAAAGFDPRSLGRLLSLALGTALIMRASLSLGDNLLAARNTANEAAQT